MRKRLIKLFCSVVFGVLLLEGLCSALAYFRYGTLDVVRINDMASTNVYTVEMPKGLAEMLLPHPHLGQVYKPERGGNNIGTRGPDFPFEKDPSKFTILFTGGSVADYAYMCGAVTKALDEYDFGKPLVVLNGACGNWKQPNEMIITAMHGEVCDAVVSLEGYNELWPIRRPDERLCMYSSQYESLNPLIKGGYERIAVSWQSNQLRQFSKRHNLRSLYYVTSALRGFLMSKMPEEQGSSTKDVLSLPQEWTRDRRALYNMGQYAKYARLMHAVADELGIKEVHFLQPCPAIGKVLTEDEKRVVGNLGYVVGIEGYERLTDEILALNDSGVPVVSLLDCFNGVSESLYSDDIHCNLPGNRGYHIIAERIASELAKLWQIREVATAGPETPTQL